MDPNAAEPPRQPQASSRSAPEPVNGLALYRREAARRDSLLSKGNLATGCGELDDEVLAGGGFERGCVVGISAEQEDFRLLIGLQTVARLLVAAQLVTPAPIHRPRAMIITMLDMAALLPMLSGVLEAQAGVLLALGGEDPAPAPARVRAVARACLEQISISRVFDLEGLWEVLQEDLIPETVPVEDADVSTSPQAAETVDPGAGGVSAATTSTTQKEPGGGAGEDPSHPPAADPGADEATERSPPPFALPSIEAVTRKAEIMDSEDEMSPLSSSPSELSPPPDSLPLPVASPTVGHGDIHQTATGTQEPPSSRSSSLSPPPASSGPSDVEAASPPQPPPPPPPPQPALPATVDQDDKTAAPGPISTTPDVILVTHMSTLITALFRRRDKQSAHSMLELLASHLRHISRSPEYGCPLVMLLNGTNAPIKTPGEQNQHHHHHHHGEDSPPPRFEGDAGGNRGGGGSGGSQRPLDPTLRSIFNLSYAPEQGYNNYHSYGHGGNNDEGGAAASAVAATTRRNKPVYGLVFTQLLDLHLLATLVPRGREDAEAALLPAGGDGGRQARYCWAVEVLLDEVGVWRGAGRLRAWREQRWGVVEVWGGVLVVDAFDGGGGGA